jgi:hypothetical protein
LCHLIRSNKEKEGKKREDFFFFASLSLAESTLKIEDELKPSVGAFAGGGWRWFPPGLLVEQPLVAAGGEPMPPTILILGGHGRWCRARDDHRLGVGG